VNFKNTLLSNWVIEGDQITKNDQAYLIDLKKQETEAKAGKTRKLPLFIGEKDGSKFYIIL